MYKKFIKRFLGIILSGTLLVILLVPMIFIALLIRIDSPGGALFRQKRIGKDQRYFYIAKFRTMFIDSDPNVPTELLDEPELRVTRVGAFLRRTSLDELPQLWNVLLGQMSIVGPRPALWNQFSLIEKREQAGVHTVRPGITGWAQVNGRDMVSEDEKVELDREYVERMSFLFDLRCLFETVSVVISKKGYFEGRR